MTSTTPIQLLSFISNGERSLALHNLLSSLPAMSLADEAANETEVLQKLDEKDIDVVLLDVSLQQMDCTNLIREIRNLHPRVRIVISTAFRRSSDIFDALDAGANGYVLMGNDEGLESAISSVRLGAVWLDPGIAKQVLEVIVAQTSRKSKSRTLPTGQFSMPLFPHEKELLKKVATSNCTDGVCMVDPSFVAKLRGYRLSL